MEDVFEHSVRSKAEAFYKGTDAITQFSKEKVISVLRGQLGLNDKELAITGTYYRMYLWAQSMVTMNSPQHFQGAASAARSLFELLLDIKILDDDKEGIQVARFHAFTEVERFRVAQNLVSFCDRHPGATGIDDTHHREFVKSPGRAQEIESKIIKYWGKNKKGKPNWPGHWSGMNMKERAEIYGIKYEELYVYEYPMSSWSVHSGPSNYAGLSKDTLESSFALSHSLAQKAFLEATVICANAIHISKVIDGFHAIVEKVRLVPGAVLVEDEIRIIKQRTQESGFG